MVPNPDISVPARKPGAPRLWDQPVAEWPAPMRMGFILLVIPLIIALWTAWEGAGRTNEWSTVQAVGFRVPMAIVNWGMAELGTRALFVLLRHRPVPLWLLLALGCTAIQPILFFVNIQYIAFYQTLFVAPELWRPMPEVGLKGTLREALPAVVMWTAINLFLVHYLGVERFGHHRRAKISGAVTPTGNHLVEPAASPLFSRLPAGIGQNIHLVIAEQHYVRVLTDQGETLILYRFSDAVRELSGHDGARVHRSYWVSRNAVIGQDRGPAGPSLILANGMKIPVSRTYREIARQAGLLDVPGQPTGQV